MIIEYIENLRKQPVDVRRKAVTFLTVVVVGIIVVLYLLYITFGAVFHSGSTAAPTQIQSPYSN